MASLRHYFDWNATTPPAVEVLDAIQRAQRELWGNPSSIHTPGRHARAAFETTREVLGQLFTVHPRDVLFTSGGTEANNLALASARLVLTSRLEHPSVVRMAERLATQGATVRWLQPNSAGVVQPDAVERELAALGERAREALVTVNAVNHETGVIQPVADLIRVAGRFAARVHVDAVQWLGKLPLQALEGAASIAVGAHKIRGPKGIGALLFRGLSPPPLLVGGAQERGLRPGTQDAACAAGFHAALLRVPDGPERQARLTPLRDRLERELSAVAEINGDSERRAPHVSNLSFRGYPGPELVAALDLAGFSVSSGSACSAGTSEPSAVIAAILGPDRAKSAVRFSLGEETDSAAVDELIAQIFRVLGA